MAVLHPGVTGRSVRHLAVEESAPGREHAPTLYPCLEGHRALIKLWKRKSAMRSFVHPQRVSSGHAFRYLQASCLACTFIFPIQVM